MSEEPLIAQSLIDSINSCHGDIRVYRPIPNCDNYFASDDGYIWYAPTSGEVFLRLELGWHDNALVCIVNGNIHRVIDLILQSFYPGIIFNIAFKDKNPWNCALDNLTLKPKKAQPKPKAPAQLNKPEPEPDPEPDRYEEAKKRFRQKNGLDS